MSAFRAIGAAAGLAAWLAMAMAVVAASPSPDAGSGGDPRSPGQGPGLVGDPGFAIMAVVALGLVTVVVTLVYVRLTARPKT